MKTKQQHPRGELVAGVDRWIKNRAGKLASFVQTPSYDRDDLAQDIALAALTRPTGPDTERGKMTTWIGHVAVSVARGKRHYHNNGIRDARRDRHLGDEAANDAYDLADGDGPDADTETMQAIAAGIREALDRLDFYERFIIERVYGLNGREPETLQDVAKTLNVPVQTVDAMMEKALVRLYWQLSPAVTRKAQRQRKRALEAVA
ncbi:hypothetical protein BH11PLA2_BH11PLA2_45830 [soil metagenome]